MNTLTQAKLFAAGFSLFVFLSVAFLHSAFADSTHTCQGNSCNGGNGGGGGGDQQQGQAQGQLQGQAQGQISVNQNTNSLSTDTRTTAYSDSVSRSDSNSGGNTLSVTNGGNTASSESDGGAATSNSVINIVGDSNERNAPSAPSVYTDYCSSGMSASSVGGSVGVSNRNILCQHVTAADTALAAWEKMRVVCDTPYKGGTDPACDFDVEATFWDSWLFHTAKIDAIARRISIPGEASSTAGYMVVPIAVGIVVSCLLGFCLI